MAYQNLSGFSTCCFHVSASSWHSLLTQPKDFNMERQTTKLGKESKKFFNYKK